MQRATVMLWGSELVSAIDALVEANGDGCCKKCHDSTNCGVAHLLDGRGFSRCFCRAIGSQVLMISPSGGGAANDEASSRSAPESAAGDEEALRRPRGAATLRQGRASVRRAQLRRAPSSRRAMVEERLA